MLLQNAGVFFESLSVPGNRNTLSRLYLLARLLFAKLEQLFR